VLGYLPVIAGLLPPKGFEPVYAFREQDVQQYLAWLAAAGKSWLLPNFHAPWITEPGLFQPLFVIAALFERASGLNLLVVYYLVHFVLYCFAAWAWLRALRTFCPNPDERAAAWSFLVCTIPIALFVPIMWFLGVIQFSYETSDGFLRGGIATSPTLTFGTAMMLLGITSLAKFLRSRVDRDLWTLHGIVLITAVVHPFEAIPLAVVGGLAFLIDRHSRVPARILRTLTIGAAASAGFLPSLITLRHPWVRAVAAFNHWEMPSLPPFWVGTRYGLPAILLVYLLLMRRKRAEPGDEVCQLWFVVVPVLALFRFLPFTLHFFDGYACVIALLLARSIPDDKLFGKWFTAHPEGFRRVLIASASVCAAVMLSCYSYLAREARSGRAQLLPSTVIAHDEKAAIDWLRKNARPDDLAVAPLVTSYSLAAIPMHSLGSQWVFSLSFQEQRIDADRFFASQMSDEEAQRFLTHYGVRYVILPPGVGPMRALQAAVNRADFGGWRVYEFPEARMNTFDQASLSGL